MQCFVLVRHAVLCVGMQCCVSAYNMLDLLQDGVLQHTIHPYDEE
jgi:hypothetical protein